MRDYNPTEARKAGKVPENMDQPRNLREQMRYMTHKARRQYLGHVRASNDTWRRGSR